jgi:hypothetical protein
VIRRLQILCLVLLLGAMVATVWRIGVVCHDDADWILYARQSLTAEGWRWATTQGRLYAAVLGPLMLHAIYWDGTLYGEVLKYAPFLGFILFYLLALRFYVGTRTALLAGALFAGLHALRFENSALTGYSMLAWPSAMAAAAAILAGQRYQQRGGKAWLAAAAVLAFLSLFTNEGLTIAFSGLFCLAWVAMRPRNRRLGAAYAGAMALYAVLGIGFRLAYPSTYVGTELAPFDLGRILGVVWHFSTGGTALHSLFRPYQMGYVASGAHHVVRYQLGDSFVVPSLYFLLLGAALGWLVWNLLAEKPAPTRRPPWSAMLPGLALMLGTQVPVALTARYQSFHHEAGIDAYFSTIFAHLGVATLLAGLLATLCSGRKFAAPIIAAMVALLGFASMQTNERIAEDMRPEGLRWQVFRSAVPLAEKAGFKEAPLVLPQFADGSWNTVLPPAYWTEYAGYLYGRAVPVRYGGDGVVITYEMSADHRDFELRLSH